MLPEDKKTLPMDVTSKDKRMEKAKTTLYFLYILVLAFSILILIFPDTPFESITDAGFFAILAIIYLITILVTEKFISSNVFVKFTYSRIFRIGLTLLVFGAASFAYAYYSYERDRREREERRSFSLNNYERGLMETLESKDVLTVDVDEVNRKYNVLSKGMYKQGVSVESQEKESAKAEVEAPSMGSIQLGKDASSSQKTDYGIDEGVELRMFSCIKYLHEKNQLDIIYIDVPYPIEKSINRYIDETLSRKAYYGFDFEIDYKVPLELRTAIFNEMRKQAFNKWLATNLKTKITGLVLVIGTFDIRDEKNTYIASSKFFFESPTISFTVVIEKENLAATSKRVLDIYLNKTLSLFVFGFAREFPETDGQTIINRNIRIISPMAIFE